MLCVALYDAYDRRALRARVTCKFVSKRGRRSQKSIPSVKTTGKKIRKQLLGRLRVIIMLKSRSEGVLCCMAQRRVEIRAKTHHGYFRPSQELLDSLLPLFPLKRVVRRGYGVLRCCSVVRQEGHGRRWRRG